MCSLGATVNQGSGISTGTSGGIPVGQLFSSQGQVFPNTRQRIVPPLPPISPAPSQPRVRSRARVQLGGPPTPVNINRAAARAQVGGSGGAAPASVLTAIGQGLLIPSLSSKKKLLGT